MHTWTTTTATTQRHGASDTERDAWHAALDAAADLVRAGAGDTITVTVNDQSAHVHPQHTDAAAADVDITATLQALDGMRASILADR